MYYSNSFWNVVANMVDSSLWIYSAIVFIAVILSWMPIRPVHPTAIAVLRFLRRATEPTFSFFRRTLRLHRYTGSLDITPLVVILIIQFLRIFLVNTIRDMAIIGYPVRFATHVLSNFLLGIFVIISSLLSFYFWVVIIAFVVAWFAIKPYHPIGQAIVNFLYMATEPVYDFLRQKLRLHQYIKTIDFISPLIVILSVFLLQALIQVVIHFANGLR
jgi:YggT family protein